MIRGRYTSFLLAALVAAATLPALARPGAIDPVFLQQHLQGATLRAQLTVTLDTRTATAGQKVSAQLVTAVKAGSTVLLPRDTQLIGEVSEVNRAQKGTPGSVVVVFTQAVLPGGVQVPLHAGISAFATDDGLPENIAINYDAASGVGTVSGASGDVRLKKGSLLLLQNAGS